MISRGLKKILELENADIGEICNTTTATFYMIADTVSMQTVNPSSYPSIAMKSCNNCKEADLKPQWEYCPNCGRKFIDD